jgi:hypothetical protein
MQHAKGQAAELEWGVGADIAVRRNDARLLVDPRRERFAAFDEGLDFEAAYRRIDWSRFAGLPAFDVANRRNAYQTYLNVEQDALDAVKQQAPPAPR